MLRRYSERLLVALVCAQVVAGCGAASQAAPGSPSAATTSSAVQPVSDPLDLCRLPDLPPPGVMSRSGYTQLAVSVTDPNGAPLVGLKKPDFTVRSDGKPSPIVYFREESSLTAPVSLVIVGDVSGSMFQKT